MGCGAVTFIVAVYTAGCCGAFVLLGGGNGLFTGSATGSIDLDGSGLAGCTASWMNFLLLVYLATGLVWPW